MQRLDCANVFPFGNGIREILYSQIQDGSIMPVEKRFIPCKFWVNHPIYRKKGTKTGFLNRVFNAALTKAPQRKLEIKESDFPPLEKYVEVFPEGFKKELT
jgi:hypothetical protein